MNYHVELKPCAPFNFELSGHIFSQGHAQIRRYEGGTFWQLIRINDLLVHLSLTSTGIPDDPLVKLNLESSEELDRKSIRKASKKAAHIYNLKLDLNRFYQEMEDDGVMKSITSQLRGLKNPLTPTIFESLMDSIIEQQISLKVAHTLQNRVIKRCGDQLVVKGIRYYSYPTPQNLCHFNVQDLRDCGLTYRKAEYLMGLSKDIVHAELDLEGMRFINDTPELIKEMCQIRGVGLWTAELSVLRSLGRYEVIPGDDVALRRIISHYYTGGKSVTPEIAREIAHKWGDWKGLGGYYLEVAEMMGLTL